MSRLAQLERLHAADPADADVLYMLGQEHANAGRTSDAIAWYDRCLAADAGYSYAHYHKAKALEAAGRIDEIKPTLEAGLATARRVGDAQAVREIGAWLGSLEGA